MADVQKWIEELRAGKVVGRIVLKNWAPRARIIAMTIVPRLYLSAHMIMAVSLGKVKFQRSLLMTDTASLPPDRAQRPTGLSWRQAQSRGDRSRNT
jgi:hypothetical protein